MGIPSGGIVFPPFILSMVVDNSPKVIPLANSLLIISDILEILTLKNNLLFSENTSLDNYVESCPVLDDFINL